VEAIEQDPGRPSLEAAKLRALMARRDGPGLVLVGVQGTAFVAGLTVATIFPGEPFGWVALAVASLGLLGAFPAMHEAGHSTAFAKPILNELVVTVCAFLMLQAPSFFREFHWQHHRKTQDREHDPEIAAAPALLDGWPTNPATYLALISGQMLLFGKAMFTVACSLLPNAAAWDKAFPFIRENKRSRVAWESRVTMLLWATVLVLGLRYIDGFAFALLAWPISHLLLGLYLLAEHTGLPNDGTQLHRTRTIISNEPLRWWMWQMPLHGAHHAFPATPFHAIPQLHAEIEPSLEHIASGYLAVHKTAIRHAFRLAGHRKSRFASTRNDFSDVHEHRK